MTACAKTKVTSCLDDIAATDTFEPFFIKDRCVFEKKGDAFHGCVKAARAAEIRVGREIVVIYLVVSAIASIVAMLVDEFFRQLRVECVQPVLLIG